MHTTVRYTIMLLSVVMLQLFFIDTLNLGMYVNPLLYVSFIILLPMNMPPVAVLMSGLGLGVIMDVCTAMGGACTAATMLSAYMRSFLLDITMGKEIASEGGMPSLDYPSPGKFMRYAGAMTTIQCFAFFTLETMTLSYFHLTLLRILLSSAATFICVIAVTMMFSRKKY